MSGNVLGVISWAVDLFESVEELITELSQNPWFFAVLFVVALLDSVVPIVPSEFSVIAGGVAAGAGTLIDGRPVLSIVLVILAGATGAYVGDSLAYWIGNRSDKLLKRWFFRGEKGEKRLFATGEQIRKRGGLLLITARFIPGGRTAMTFSCGLTGQPFLRWFTRWDILAVTLWASYAGLLGYFVASAIENQRTALWLAFGFALSLTVLIEVGRWLLDRVRSGPDPETVT
ncbi:MAG: DedA family protein [Acidimicrobiia bacterium]|nr:DedA family protein [Acidimicrobiia bacterium]